jgi:hypothetical protein
MAPIPYSSIPITPLGGTVPHTVNTEFTGLMRLMNISTLRVERVVEYRGKKGTFMDASAETCRRRRHESAR